MPRTAHLAPPLLALPLALAAACGGSPPVPAEDAPPAESASAGDAATEAASEASGDQGAPAELSGALQWEAPEAWVEEAPSSSMRVAQFRLPHEAGDAELGIFRFPGGGSVEANFQRWAGQFEQPDGGDSMEAATFSERTVNGMRVHEMDVSGRYAPSSFPGMPAAEPADDQRLRGAIVESPYGLYFVKATGPIETLAANEASYRAFVSSLRP